MTGGARGRGRALVDEGAASPVVVTERAPAPAGGPGSADPVDPAVPLDQAGVAGAADILRALSNPHRVAIVLQLAGKEQCVHELVAALGVSQPLVSQHLRVLRAERLVTGRRRGREIAYSLPDQHVARIVRDAVTHAAERGAR